MVRQIAPPDTLGGGVILDPRPRKHGPSRELLVRLAATVPGRTSAAEPRERAAAGAREPSTTLAASRRRRGQPRLTESALALERRLRAARSSRRWTQTSTPRDLSALRAAGRAVRVSKTLHYHPETLAHVRPRAIELAARRGGMITLAQFRDELGTSRKFAQALLEHLDAERVTIRRGESHYLRKALPVSGRRTDSTPSRAVDSATCLHVSSPAAPGSSGRTCATNCCAADNRVICVDNLETGSLANIEHIRGDDFVHLNLDIIQPYYVEETVDFVYHLASPASPIDYLRLPLHTLKVGSYGTHHTLGLAKKHRARFLTASTSEVYGDPKIHPQPESYWGHVNPIGPRGVYDEAKRYAEALTMAYHRQQGVDTAIVRIFNTYGPRMRPHDGRAIPTFLRQALQDRPITVFGDGSQTRSFCYVDDLIRGIIGLSESGYHDPVNIGNPNEFTLLELAKAVLEITGSRSEIVYEALPTDDPQVRQPDITLAQEILGWGPEIDLREGLRRTIEQSGVEALVGAAR